MSGAPRSLPLCILPLALLGLIGCGRPPECAPPGVTLPASAQLIPWRDGTAGELDGMIGDRAATLLLDTGTARSAALSPAHAPVELSALRLAAGELRAGPLFAGALSGRPPAEALLGVDVLAQVPFALDARARTTRLEPSFSTGGAAGAPVRHLRSGLCVDDDPGAGPDGHEALVIEVTVEGTPRTFVLATGLEFSLVRTTVASTLSGRTTLDGVWTWTPFAGPLEVRALRTRTLEVGGAVSAHAVLGTTFQVDHALDTLQAQLEGSCEACDALQLDGFLGRSFLREFAVDLTARDADGVRRLGLTRFASQDHWTRDFVGIGAYLVRTEEPPGLRVDGFYDRAPAEDAGMKLDDRIVRVNGVPALEAPLPFAPVGETVTLEIDRRGTPLVFEVEQADLLPDPS